MKKTTPIGSKKKAKCALHGVYETLVLTIAGQEHPARCPKCVENETREAVDRKRDRQQQQLRYAEIPPRYLDRTFDNYRPVNAKAREVLRSCENYAESFEQVRSHGGGLILCGRPGTGKTHLACAIARHVITAHARPVWYTTTASAVRFVKQTYAPASGASETDALKRFQRPALLILDEVGMQRGTDYEVTLLAEILNERYAAVKPTMLVTNHTHEELARFIGPRAIDRMREGGGVVLSLDWESYRAKVESDNNLGWPVPVDTAGA